MEGFWKEYFKANRSFFIFVMVVGLVVGVVIAGFVFIVQAT
jgi:hypothetical protein